MTPFEHGILVFLKEHGNRATTVEIRIGLAGGEGRDWPSIGAVYAAAERLEEQGHVQIESAPGGPERGSRPRRQIRLTGHGLAAAREAPPSGI